MNMHAEASVLTDKRICSSCIGEAFLNSEVDSIGEDARCDYCEDNGRTITIGKLADYVDEAFKTHFECTPNEPDGYESALLRDPEIEYEWQRKGDPVAYVIADVVQVNEGVAEHIRIVLDDRYYDFEDAKSGAESLYDSEAHYEKKRPEDYQLRVDWVHFQKTLKTETRLFNREAESVLDIIFEGLTAHTTHEGKPVIIDAGPGQAISHLFRARTFQSDEALKAALVRPDLEIGPPPSPAAVAGRMNARGISVFYGATDPRVALAEIRPPVGSRAVVARFDFTRSVRLLNVEALRSIYVESSVFHPLHAHRLGKANFLGRLSHRITMPVMPEDEPSDYLVTQAIADYLASRKDPVIDGIIYGSIQNGSRGSNIVLFHKSSRVELFKISKETELRAHLEDWSDEGPEPNYQVWEEIPSKIGKIKKNEDDFPLSEFVRISSVDSDDDRLPVLRLDVTTLMVHHIESVAFNTQSFPVERIQIEKTMEF